MANVYMPTGVPGKALLVDEPVPLPQPETPTRKQVATVRSPKRLTLRIPAKKNTNAIATQPMPRQWLPLPGNSKLPCAAVVETVNVAVPLFVREAGLMEQVLSVGFPEHN